jgi:hypothetical protein
MQLSPAIKRLREQLEDRPPGVPLPDPTADMVRSYILVALAAIEARRVWVAPASIHAWLLTARSIDPAVIDRIRDRIDDIDAVENETAFLIAAFDSACRSAEG